MPIIVAGQSKAMILFPGLFYSGLCPVYTFRQPTLNRFTLFEHWMNFIQSTLYSPWPKLNFTPFEHWINLHPEYNFTGHWPNSISHYLNTGWSSSTVQLYRPLAKLNFTLLEGGVKYLHAKSTLLRPWVKLSSTSFEEWMNFIQRTLYRPIYLPVG